MIKISASRQSEFVAPHLFMTNVVKDELPIGIAPTKSGLSDSQCQCTDCESSDCGPNGP